MTLVIKSRGEEEVRGGEGRLLLPLNKNKSFRIF